MIAKPEQVNEMLQDPSVTTIDVRPKSMYDMRHLPGAINLPLDRIDDETAEEIIPDKDSKVVLYCNTGMHSGMAAKKLDEMGYKNIYDLEGGITAWPYDTQAKLQN